MPSVEAAEPRETASGDVDRWTDEAEDHFEQPADFYRNVLDDAHRDRLTDNLAGHLVNAKQYIIDRQLGEKGLEKLEYFYTVPYPLLPNDPLSPLLQNRPGLWRAY